MGEEVHRDIWLQCNPLYGVHELAHEPELHRKRFAAV